LHFPCAALTPNHGHITIRPPPCCSALLHVPASRDFTVQCGYGHYMRLMQRLGTVIDVFLGLLLLLRSFVCSCKQGLHSAVRVRALRAADAASGHCD
jgi:hypothetical protein